MNMLTLAQTIALTNDADNDGAIDPLDTVTVTARIGAVGGPVDNVSYLSNLTRLTQVAGTLKITPIAYDDSYTLTGNTPLTVSAALGVLFNDRDPDAATGLTAITPVLTDASGNATAGTVALNADGSFTFTPTTGFTGTTGFKYTAHDAQNLNSVVTGQVTLTVGGPLVWYVDSAYAGANGTADGSFARPYTSLAALSGAAGGDAAGDTIFVYARGADAYTSGITLLNNQTLLGDSQTLLVNGISIGSASSDRTQIDFTASGVVLAGGNTVRGFTLDGGAVAATAIQDGNATVGALTISDTATSGAGKAVDIDQGGALNVSLASVSTSGSTSEAIDLQGVTGAFNVAGGAITGAAGAAVNISGGSVGGTIAASVSHAGAGAAAAVGGGHTGVLTFSGGVSATGGTGLQFANADGNYTFSGTTTLNGGDAGIDITGGSSGAFSFGSGTSITNPTGGAFRLAGSAANVTYSGSITNNAGRVVNIDNHGAGTITFETGSITSTGQGISVTNSNGGSVSFNGQTTLTTGVNPGVSLTSNTGSTVNFAPKGAGLDITTTTGAGFTASGGGTVNVGVTTSPTTDPGNTITSGSGGGLSIDGATIGGAGLTFEKISSNGAANGIFLRNTGPNGLTVTGADGPDAGAAVDAGSGGVINASIGADGGPAGHGVYLENAARVSLSGLTITGSSNSGLRGIGVNGLRLDGATITGNGDNTGFNDSGVLLTNLSGAGIGSLNNTFISNSTISNNREFQVQVVNDTGTLTDLQLIGNTISKTDALGGGNLLNFLGAGSAVMTLTVAGGAFSGNAGLTTAGSGVQVNADGFSGSVTANISGATFTDLNNGVNLGAGGAQTLRFDVFGNTVLGSDSTALNLFTDVVSTGLVSGKFRGNIIGTVGVDGSGSLDGYGIRVSSESTSTANPVTLLIDGNTIRETSFASIGVFTGLSGDDTSTKPLNVTITNNTLSEADDAGIIVDQRNDAGFAGVINADIRGNVLGAGIDGFNYDGLEPIFLRQRPGGTFNLVQTSKANLESVNGVTSPRSVLTEGTITYAQAGPAQPNAALVGEPLLSGAAGTADALVTASARETSPARDGAAEGGGATTSPVTATPAGVVTHDLSAEQLASAVAEAIARWEATGLTAAQSQALHAAGVSLATVMGQELGVLAGGRVYIDTDAAGLGWFVDGTSGDDAEFTRAPGDTRALAATDSPASGHVDLLTVVMHELGHVLGLADRDAAEDRDALMFGRTGAGERRLPAVGEAAAAVPGSVVSDAQALGPVSIGQLPAGKAVDVIFQARADAQPPGLIQTASVAGEASGAAVTTVNVTTTAVVDSVTFGGTVFNDADRDGGFDAGEGVSGVALTLYTDNGDGVFGAGDTLVTSTLTGADGTYAFAGLSPGDYIVSIDASNFAGGGPLEGQQSAAAYGGDPDNDLDGDSNLLPRTTGEPGYTTAVTLSYGGEPINDGDDADTNSSVDLGLVANSRPLLDLSAAAAGVDSSSTFVEGGPPAAIAAADATVSDPDGDNLVSAVFTLLTRRPGDALTIVGTLPGGITPTAYNAATGVLSLTGSASAAAYQSALRDNVRYTNSSNDPILVARLVDVAVSDGQISTRAAANIAVVGVNDAPTVAATAVNATFTEGGAAADLFSGVAVSTVEAGQGIDQIVLSLTGVGAGDVLSFDRSQIAAVPGASATTAGSAFAVSVTGTAAAPIFTFTKAGGVSAATASAAIDGAALGNGSENPGAGSRTVTLVSVRDTGGVANGGVDTATVNIASTVAFAPVNDAPTAAAPATLAAVEDAPVSLKGIGLTVADADGGAGVETVTLTVGVGALAAASGGGVTASGSGLSVTLSGTAAALDAYLAGGPGALTYTANLNDPPASTVLTLSINDGGAGGPSGGPGIAAQATTTVNITPVNDEPTAAATAVNATFTERGPAAAVFSGAAISTVEAGQSILGLTFTVTNVAAGDRLTIDGTTLALDAPFSGGTANGRAAVVSVSGGAATLMLSGSPFSSATAEGIVNGLRFSSVSEAPAAAARTVTLTSVRDNGGVSNGGDDTAALSISSTVTVAGVNDAPDLTAPASLAPIEQVSLSLRGAGLSVADVDGGGSIERLTLTTTGATLAGTPGGSDVNITSVAGGLQIEGTLAQLNAFLGSGGTATLTVTTLSDDPATAGPLTLSLVLDDRGAGGASATDALTDSVSVTLNVAPVNDAPVIDAATGSAAFVEDGGPVAVAPTLTLADADSATLAQATVRITSGLRAGDVLAFTNTSAVTFGNVGASFDAVTGALTLASAGATATVAQFQAALRAVTFDNASADPDVTTRTLSFTASDGAATSLAATRTLSVAGVNDAPTASAAASGATFTENGAAVDVFTAVTLGTVEAGQGVDRLGLTVSNVRAGDRLTLDGAAVPLADGTSVTTPSGYAVTVASVGGAAAVTISLPGGVPPATAAALVDAMTFASTSDDPGSDARTVTLVSVRDTGGVANGGADTLTTSLASTIAVVPVNDAPTDVAVVSGALTLAENPANGTVVVGLRGVDPDSQAVFLSLRDSAGGRFALDGQGRLVVADGTLIDFEQATSHVVRVRASDGSGLFFERAFTIQVTDVASEAASGSSAGDTLVGGAGPDTFMGLTGSDSLSGGGGDDVLYGNQDNDVLNGGADNDALFGGQGNDQLFGGNGADVLEGGAGDDVISGGDGLDTAAYAFSPAGVTVTLLQPGVAQNTGGAGIDTLSGVENLTGSGLADTLTGDGADNRLQGGGGNDTLNGGLGRDLLYGEAGDDILYGNQDADLLRGGDGADSLFGGQGDDVLFGDDGADLLQGGLGVDLLTGGAGADMFRYVTVGDSPFAAFDTIADFQSALDVLDLRAVRTGAADTFAISSATGVTYVDVDLGGNGSIDMRVALTGTGAIQPTDVLFG